MRELIRLVLEASGYAVAWARNGKEARRVLEGSSFDVVLTDLLMPECDGLELIGELVKNNPTVGIVAMSGGGHVAGEHYLQMAKSFGAHVLLSKPFSHDRLFAAVEEAWAGMSELRAGMRTAP